MYVYIIKVYIYIILILYIYWNKILLLTIKNIVLIILFVIFIFIFFFNGLYLFINWFSRISKFINSSWIYSIYPSLVQKDEKYNIYNEIKINKYEIKMYIIFYKYATYFIFLHTISKTPQSIHGWHFNNKCKYIINKCI